MIKNYGDNDKVCSPNQTSYPFSSSTMEYTSNAQDWVCPFLIRKTQYFHCFKNCLVYAPFGHKFTYSRRVCTFPTCLTLNLALGVFLSGPLPLALLMLFLPSSSTTCNLAFARDSGRTEMESVQFTLFLPSHLVIIHKGKWNSKKECGEWTAPVLSERSFNHPATQHSSPPRALK